MLWQNTDSGKAHSYWVSVVRTTSAAWNRAWMTTGRYRRNHSLTSWRKAPFMKCNWNWKILKKIQDYPIILKIIYLYVMRKGKLTNRKIIGDLLYLTTMFGFDLIRKFFKMKNTIILIVSRAYFSPKHLRGPILNGMNELEMILSVINLVGLNRSLWCQYAEFLWIEYIGISTDIPLSSFSENVIENDHEISTIIVSRKNYLRKNRYPLSKYAQQKLMVVKTEVIHW